MTATLITVPCDLIRVRASMLELQGGIVSPGVTGAGQFPVTDYSGGGLWGLEYTELLITTPLKRRAWRSITGLCQRGLNKLIVPFHDDLAPWPLVNEVAITAQSQIPHDDDTLFDDDTGYDQPVIDVVTVGAAALRATSIALQLNFASEFLGGEHFSIEHVTQSWHIYRVNTVEIDDDGNSVVTFSPPLREGVADGTQVEFDCPRCIMQPYPPNSMNLTEDMLRVARPSPKFIEAFL